MHRHLHVVRSANEPSKGTPRPAKVVQLEARRKARLAVARPTHNTPRPAA